jgi:Bacterial SH3 domain
MRLTVLIIILQCLLSGLVYGAEKYRVVQIADPFIELRTGAGRGYPIFLVVERGETLTLLKRKTDWFKVRTKTNQVGWVNIRQLQQTLGPTGDATQFKEMSVRDYKLSHWKIGLSGGDYGGAREISLYGGCHLAEHLSTELTLSQILGNYSSSLSAKASLLAYPFTQWRFAPFFALGTGVIHTNPRTTLVQAQNRTDQFASVGIGIHTYVTRRFVFRIEYSDYIVFSSNNANDTNEEIHEWKAGFAIFL